MLGYLAEHAGQAVSRERLLSEVWGYGFDPGSNVVDVCVRRIRRRLGDALPDRDSAQCGVPRRVRLGLSDLACLALVAANLVALVWLAGVGDGADPRAARCRRHRVPLAAPAADDRTRDAIGFATALTLATIGNELLEGIEPINDVYEAWLIVVLVGGLGWLAVRRAQTASALEELAAERERLLRRQERLMYDLSHELRTPATIARGHLEPAAQ